MKLRRTPKDPKVARVYTIGDGPSEQYNALVPTHFNEKWDAWYFWFPMPMGTYYAADLLKMMLVILETDLCVLVNQKQDKMPQYNTGIYWIIDLVKKDFENGTAGIIEKVRGEIETVLSTNRFPEDEIERLRTEVEDEFQEWMSERKDIGLPTSPLSPDAALDPKPAPKPDPKPAPKKSTRPSKAIPIVDPKSVENEDKAAPSSEVDTSTTRKKSPKAKRLSHAVPIVNLKGAQAQGSSSLQNTGTVMPSTHAATMAVASSAPRTPFSMAPRAPSGSSHGPYRKGPGAHTGAHPGNHPRVHRPHYGSHLGPRPRAHLGAQFGAHLGPHPGGNSYGHPTAHNMHPQAGLPLAPRPNAPGGFQYGSANVNNLPIHPHPTFAGPHGSVTPSPVYGQGFGPVGGPIPGPALGAHGPYRYVAPKYQYPGGPRGYFQPVYPVSHNHSLGPGTNYSCPPFYGPPRAPFPCAQPRAHAMAPRAIDRMAVLEDPPTSPSVVGLSAVCPDTSYPGPQFRETDSTIPEAAASGSKESTPRVTKPDVFMDETSLEKTPTGAQSMKPSLVVRLPVAPVSTAVTYSRVPASTNAPASEIQGFDRTIPEKAPAGPRRKRTPIVRLPTSYDSPFDINTAAGGVQGIDRTIPDGAPADPRNQAHANNPMATTSGETQGSASIAGSASPADAPTGPRNLDAPVEYMMLQSCVCSTASLGDYIDAALARSDTASQAKADRAEKRDDVQEGAEK